jgi:alpha-L-rhamnosidase
VVTLGSEATVVRDVVVERCRVLGSISLAVLKLRPDTPQRYEDVHYRHITLDGTGTILSGQPWRQYFDLKGQPPPQSVVRNLTLSDLKGRYGSFGVLRGNAGQTEIRDVTLERIDVRLRNERLRTGDVKDLKIADVTVNGKPLPPQAQD